MKNFFMGISWIACRHGIKMKLKDMFDKIKKQPMPTEEELLEQMKNYKSDGQERWG